MFYRKNMGSKESWARVIAGANQNVVLSATGNFINSEGSDAISVSGTGRCVTPWSERPAPASP